MPKPVLQALILADHVYQDRETGKRIIAGTFNQIFFTKPAPAPGSVAVAPPAPGSAPPPSAPGGEGRRPEPPSGPGMAAAEEPRRPGAGPGAAGAPEARKPPWHGFARAGSPYAFLSLTDVHGSAPLELRYVDLSQNAVLMRINFTVRCDDPLCTVEASVPVPSLPTPHAGVYALELLCENDLLGALRIKAVEAAPP